MKRANCPSCGAPVVFRAATSIYVVCEFCRSTLLRAGEDLRNLGRMAELLEDASLLQLGSEGVFRRQPFSVIGRIQLKYEAGLWNEWHILFADGRTAWLAEAAGEYIVSAQAQVSDSVPEFATLAPAMELTVDGRSFTVSDLQTAQCISGQGELPFKVAAGYAVNTADLRSKDRFLTIDYSETPPLLFVGQAVAFADLQLSHLKTGDDHFAGSAPQVAARAFACPQCAASLHIHSPDSVSVACGSCGAIIGVDNENIQLLVTAAQALRAVPWLALGSQGKLHGVDWEVIGFMRRSTRSQGVDYPWSEYLLFNAQTGFAWLVEYQGHWNFVRSLSTPPSVRSGQAEFSHHGQDFKHFNSAVAEVTYVVGEFYWRVAVGERCTVDDYVCPPLMLSRELSDQELTWSQGEYLEPGDLSAAFAIRRLSPPRIGVYANQPNPLIARHRQVCRVFWKLALTAVVLQLAFAFLFAAQVVHKQPLMFPAGAGEDSVRSQDIVLSSRARTLLVRHSTDLDNNWLSLSTTLVEKNTGEAYVGDQEISYYSGSSGGEGWSEGSASDEMAFKAVPAGTYYLMIDYELGKDRRAAVGDTLEVIRNPAAWTNLVLLLIFLAVFPLFSRWRRNAFEAQRWNESDLAGEED